MVTHSLIFSSPAWFWCLIPAAILPLLLTLWGMRLRRRRLRLFCGTLATKQRADKGAWLRLFWTVAALSALVFAMARPLLGERKQDADRLGIDLIIAVDLSRSMLADDMTPTRLQVTKDAIIKLMDELGNDRIMLIGFAGEARMLAPMTIDHNALKLVLDSMNQRTVWRGGSSIESAITLVNEKAQEGKVESSVLVIITDGEELEGDALLAARRSRLDSSIPVFTVGVGTRGGTALRVPSRNDRSETPKLSQVYDKQRRAVHTRLDESNLQAIANAGGGSYIALGQEGEGLINMLENHLKPMAQTRRQEEISSHVELFQIPLGIGLLMLALSFCLTRWPNLSLRRKSKAARAANAPAIATAALVLFMALPCSASVTPSERWQQVHEQATELMKNGKAQDATLLLQDALLQSPNDPYLLYNYGVSALAAGHRDTARSAWSQVAATANTLDPQLVARARFQLGNLEAIDAHANASNKKLDQAIIQFEAARAQYQQSMSHKHSGRKAAESNTELVEGRLAVIYLARAEKYLPTQALIDHSYKSSFGLQRLIEKADISLADVDSAEALGAPADAVTEMRDKTNAMKLDAMLALARVKSKVEGKKAMIAAREALSLYDQVLEKRPENNAAQQERDELKDRMAKLLEEQGDAFMEKSKQQTHPHKAMSELGKAIEPYTEASELSPDNEEIAAKKDAAIKDYVEFALDSAEEAIKGIEEKPDMSANAQLWRMSEAAKRLDSADQMKPGDEEVQAMSARVDQKLQEAFVARAEEGMAAAKEAMEEAKAKSEQAGDSPGEHEEAVKESQGAVAQLEKSVADFNQALAIGEDDGEEGGKEGGKEDAAKMEAGREEAIKTLNEARQELAEQLNKAGEAAEAQAPGEGKGEPGGEPGEGEPGEGGKPGEEGSPEGAGEAVEVRNLIVQEGGKSGGRKSNFNSNRDPVDRDW